MDIILNGKDFNIDNNLTLTDLIKLKELNRERVIIQVDEEIVKKESFDSFNIKNNSKIEILAIVGGG